MTAKANSRARKRRRITCTEIAEYMKLVESGKIPACKEQHQLMAYLRRVFAEEALIIDYERIEGYRAYEKYFPFDLFPWEWFAFTLFMCVFRADGTPRWSQELIYMGRGGGKNGYDSFVAFCALTKVNGIRDYDVDICANSEEQAMTSFKDVWNILENTGKRTKFKKGFSWNLEHITCRSTNSTLKYRTDNPKSKDGLRSGMVIFDEVHAYQDWRNIKVFTTGLGKKPHPRRLYTTTDGDVRDGVLDNLLEKARRILSGEMDDNGFLPLIWKLDTADEVHNKDMWPKACPSLPYLPVLKKQIEEEYADFLVNPAGNADFMTKRMNLPAGNPDYQVTDYENLRIASRVRPDLAGWPCVFGIDYAKTQDFVAAALLFRDGEQYYVIHHSWVCKQSNDLPRVRAPLDEWEQKGLLEYVDNVEIHPSVVTGWLCDQMQDFDVMCGAIDMYRHSIFMRELDNIGFSAKEGTVKLVRPSDMMLVQPVINSAFLNHKIAWGDDAMMRWYTNNVKMTRAAHGNYSYEKIEPKSRKTDGFMAMAAAFAVTDKLPETNHIDFMAPMTF